MTDDTYAIIGAGPSGLAAARNLSRLGIPWVGHELGDDVGGLWNIEAPRSTVYESAHLISSRTTTQFTEFPMGDDVADYPSHRELAAYFNAFADTFDLRSGFRFGTEVTAVRRDGDAWAVTVRGPGGTEETVLTDPFDYAAEDRLMDAWLSARASVEPLADGFTTPPGYGLGVACSASASRIISLSSRSVISIAASVGRSAAAVPLVRSVTKRWARSSRSANAIGL